MIMYCKKCGKQIQDGSRFCEYCGTKHEHGDEFRPIRIQHEEQPYNNYADSRRNIRQSELDELNNMIHYFSYKQEQYDEFDSVCGTLSEADRILSQSPSGSFIFSGIALGFMLLGLLFGSNGFGTFLMIVGLILAIPGVIKLVMYFSRKSFWTKKKTLAEQRYEELSSELMQYYQQYSYCPVGVEYTNPAILQQLRDVIQSGYADTTRDAINYLIQQQHNATIEKNTAAASNAAKTAAVFTAANFIFRR